MGERARLAAFVERFPVVQVLVAGDVMLDRYVHGSVERISPEAPIPVLRVERDMAMLGGAGNVVRNLRALGVRADLATVTGDDEAGAEVRRLLANDESITDGVLTVPGRCTTIKTRFIAHAQQVLRADRETTAALAEPDRRALQDEAQRLLDDAAVLILSDYGKGVLAAGVAGELIAAARRAGRPVIVDPKGRDYRPYAGADIITPNRVELAEASGRPVSGPETVEVAARRLIADVGFATVIATLGSDGMMVVPATGPVHHLPAEAREVYDVSGAGDTVVATLAAALAAGAGLIDAATLANTAAGIVVAKVGTAVAWAAEIADALRHGELADAEAKVLGRGPARDRVERWRRQGLRIGFTNGCFDLLHPGHVSLLAQARQACDRLVVGLNSDTSVARLKGPGRPVQPETARATVLASLSDVDAVVVFEDDTPLELIAALRPDVLIKGADYRLDEVVGADLVQGWGGRVVLAHLEPGHSTTATIARIATDEPVRRAPLS